MLSSTDLVQAVTADLEKIRETAPLVLSLTNSVVQPLTANLLLAIGAVPAMLNDAEEAVDMLRSGTGALLVNLGTVTREQGAAMQTAVREANRLNIPWVLDPVAVGALSLRTRLAEQLKEQSPRIIRGNASEIMALAGYSSVTKGPESTSSSADALHAARELALHTGAAVLVTGRTDYSTDGRQVTATENGHAMMSRVTGVGCSMGALSAACAAVGPPPRQGGGGRTELRRGEPVADLRNAIGINDKFLLIRDLFGGDGEAYEEAIGRLNDCADFDDCMIYIAENYAWNPNSDGVKLLMELLERKFA